MIKLSKEEMDAIRFAALDDSTKLISYLNDQKESKWKKWIYAIISFVAGSVFTKLLDTYWNDIICFFQDLFNKQ